MEIVAAGEARTHFPQLLERAAQGEEFLITACDKPIAPLVPATGPDPKRHARDGVEAMKQFRQTIPLGGLSVRELIEDGRRFEEWIQWRLTRALSSMVRLLWSDASLTKLTITQPPSSIRCLNWKPL